MNTFERYIWLVDTLRRNGRLSYDEIASKWEKAAQNDAHLPLEKRSFLNHIKAIEAQMGICIVCDRRDGYRYYIKEDETPSGVTGWLMESMAVSNTVSESRDLAGRIMLERIPSGHQHLQTIIDAMHNGTVISIQHLSYWRTEPTIREIHPYGLRLADRRWYLIGYVEEYKEVRVYGLDRIIDIDITERRFEFPKDFDLEKFFEGCCGVIRQGDIQTVRIKVTDNQQKYIDSLPLHESQRLIERNDEKNYAIFEYRVRPTMDFIMKILAYGSSVEVIKPLQLRQKVMDTVLKMENKYFNLKEKRSENTSGNV